ncbi:hypothetical protein [Hydrocarboniclastica marina]|uniref:Uncharacterized protein n=1 Tax=Hydrocarboniclastica marina TaxID=2259620 RepID=A0A4P7XLU1_9ALTE|nr:hypothetical protein [Hydrocarboniclastica marina]QCF28098.1 hypothetical protein soil367_18670 [Hydrocarboniclastica marina]
MKRITAFALFVLVCLFAIYLEYSLSIVRNAYWLCHFMWSLFFPLLFYSWGLKPKQVFELVFWASVGNEFSDALAHGFFQFDHFGADMAGLAIAIGIYLKVAGQGWFFAKKDAK